MKPELLGTVTAPSGTILLVDLGLLGYWSHLRSPSEDALRDLPEVIHLSEAARDFRVEGPDAAVASLHFGRSPGWLYDRLPAFPEEFSRVAQERGWSAQLVELPEQVPHRQRVDHCLASGAAGPVEFHGVWGLAIGDLPRDQTFDLLGRRMGVGDFPRSWDQVELLVRPDLEVVRSEPLEQVPVDCARLGFLDVDALGAWRHEEPMDGRADLVFWGRDAELAASFSGACDLGEGCFGWLNLAVAEAVERGLALEKAKQVRHLKLALDFRPHSHHYRLLERMRDSSSEAGTLLVGGARVSAFFTTWGDGFFPVERDLGPGGEVAAVRILLGTEASVRNKQVVNY